MATHSVARPSPVRTCVGCRKRDAAARLIRVVAEPVPSGGTRLVIDIRRNLPGRGAWLHTGDCVSLALRRKAFGPALRERELIVDPDDLVDRIGEIST